MNRLLFEKRGDAVWISHLDLMRVFQRAFRRAGFLLKHTGGFNQHAYVSLALPLSVGTESGCEIMDFELEETFVPENLCERLNAALPAGVRVLEVYESAAKLKELTHLHAQVVLEYDGGFSDETEQALKELFDRAELPVEKKTKKGMATVDIRPMIRFLKVERISGTELLLDAVVCAQNPSLNPAQLVNAIETHLPACRPDFSLCRRIEVLREDSTPFR
ncbi:MAG: DUF2344 domain-containing protein [Oscillospiraceae bacterium]|nr:DUF2344 domain-containing protein [Oscillospiraceae bacterium]